MSKGKTRTMITRSREFNLGRDTTRIKDPRDAERQTHTVDALLDRLFARKPAERCEIQILADEVGMGKTFVALGVAYSVLAAMMNGSDKDELKGCYRKVLIVSPQNAALCDKWQRETSEFVKRCVTSADDQQLRRRWFAPQKIERVDDLVAALRNTSSSPRVLVTDMGLFAGRKLKQYDVKRRVVLGLVFRHWGVAFRLVQRRLLLKGAPNGWPSVPDGLLDPTDEEQRKLPLPVADLRRALSQAAGDEKSKVPRLLNSLLEVCREIAQPYTRGRETKFKQVERLLADLYRKLCAQMISQAFPLVVVDEAHNWKNHSNGFGDFCDLIAPRARRMLLLTATPFQLRPDELLQILKLSDHLACGATRKESEARQNVLRELRETVVRPVLTRSVESSRRFQTAWAKLPPSVTSLDQEQIWCSQTLVAARDRLLELARMKGVVCTKAADNIIEPAVAPLDPEVRKFFREALRLQVRNSDLSAELGRFVIRHRRKTDHRLFKVGAEFASVSDSNNLRADAHLLHRAPGLDVRGEGELPHYLLMRCVSEMNDKTGRSSLGTALTGCYSTLLHSDEGKRLKKSLGRTPTGSLYLEMLLGMVDERHDESHPKVREAVDMAVRNWRAGEKTLIFCFRVNTARRLREIIDTRIRKELEARQTACLGGKDRLVSLRQRLTSRERDLITLGLDRVLWSLLWAAENQPLPPAPYSASDLQLTDDDLRELAVLALRYDIDLTGERVDRVFLHRATEHLLATRILAKRKPSDIWKRILEDMASPEWIELPYGLGSEDMADEQGEDAGSFDEKGVHHVYDPSDSPDDVSEEKVSALALQLRDRRQHARQTGSFPVLDTYAEGPNLWLGERPQAPTGKSETTPEDDVLKSLHTDLWHLSRADFAGANDNPLDWKWRLLAMQASRRALLRDSVLVRLLPDKTELAEENWGVLLARAFFKPLPGQHESMADRIAVFLEDLQAGGREAREQLLDATRLRDQSFVTLVSGERSAADKSRIFMGFNTPLLPEVLVCTSVGQEGIDLHRHCRHVIHYDLAWNPATIEQRTGRTDRIGSKTFRELARNSPVRLEVGVPFLAGTYDERMYEELLLRAQAFEVLTGGDLAADNPTDCDIEPGDSDALSVTAQLPSLPDTMIRDLRVNLHVYGSMQTAPQGQFTEASTLSVPQLQFDNAGNDEATR